MLVKESVEFYCKKKSTKGWDNDNSNGVGLKEGVMVCGLWCVVPRYGELSELRGSRANSSSLFRYLLM